MYKIKNTELTFESRIFHLHKIYYSALLNVCFYTAIYGLSQPNLPPFAKASATITTQACNILIISSMHKTQATLAKTYLLSKGPLNFSYIINNPLSDFLRSVMFAAFNLNLRCTHIGIKRSINSLTYNLPFFFEVKIFKKHSRR